VCATAGKVAAAISPEMGFASARLTLDFADGRSVTRTVPVAKGHPGNPMNWDDMRAKFDALAAPLLGRRSESLFALARDFGRGGTLAEMRGILASL
jgi:2-methylcitrate dehydratase PrpD